MAVRCNKEDGPENKTALAPPAVRAPVFPHAHPVTVGLKSSILPAESHSGADVRIYW